MTAITERPPLVSHEALPMVPALAEIVDVSVREEAAHTLTYIMRFCDPAQRARYRFLPGQFNMVYVFGVGEAAISLSSDPARTETIAHTIRSVGAVTRAIREAEVGSIIGIRGPLGRPWPLRDLRGMDVLMMAGGIGLAPLRPAIYHILANRQDYGRVVLLYGSRAPSNLIYADELQEWQKRRDFQVLVTVDHTEGTDWRGPVGVVTLLLRRIRVDAKRTAVLVCGPRVMNRFAAFQFRRLHVPPERIYVSLERNMRCGIGHCGHCQYGPKFICKDGPIFSYAEVMDIFGRPEI